MKRIFVVTVISVVVLLLWNPPLSWAVTKAKVDDRLENAGLVAKEAIGIRSRIPQLLLNKAYCVIVIPFGAQDFVWLWRKLWSWSHELPDW